MKKENPDDVVIIMALLGIIVVLSLILAVR